MASGLSEIVMQGLAPASSSSPVCLSVFMSVCLFQSENDDDCDTTENDMILVPPFARHKIQPRPTHSSILKITKLPNNLRPGVCKFNNKNYTELSRADRKLPKK